MSKKVEYDIPEDSLVILVGVAGSGKSTLAKSFANDESEIVSTDAIRKEINGNEADQSNSKQVFEEFHRRVEERLKEGKLTIADATSIREFARKNLYELANKYNRPIRVAVMNVPLKQILEQNKKRERKVPDEVIIKMYESMQTEYRKIDKEIKDIPNAKVCDIFVDRNRNNDSFEKE